MEDSGIPFARHPKTEDLIEALEAVKEGEVITYAKLSSIAGGNVQAEVRNRLNSARNHLSRKGIEFLTLTGEGLRRADPSKLVEESTVNIKRVGKAARKYKRRLLNADYERLSKEERQLQTRNGLVFSLQESVTRKKSLKTLEEGAASAAERRRLDAQEAIRRLSGS